MIRFLILFEGRTGSTMLGQMLNQHPQVIHIGEEVSHLQEEGWDAQESWMNNLFFDTQHFKDPRIKKDAKAIGFKVKLRKIASEKALQHYIAEHDLKIIYMTRKNKVKQVISSIRAIDLYKSTGSYNVNGNKAIDLPNSQHIPLDRFNTILLWILEAEKRLECFVSRLNAPVLPITYEALTGDRITTLELVFKFLGVKPVESSPITRKITADDLGKVVKNLDELKWFYRHTAFGPMFEK